MFGNPEDSVETIKKTIEYSRFLPNQLVQFSVFTPYPGTPAYNEFKNKWEQYFPTWQRLIKHENINLTWYEMPHLKKETE